MPRDPADPAAGTLTGMQELVLALDIGSSSVRCRAYDQATRHVSSTPDNPPLHTRTYALGNDGTLPVGEVTAAADAVVDDCLAERGDETG